MSPLTPPKCKHCKDWGTLANGKRCRHCYHIPKKLERLCPPTRAGTVFPTERQPWQHSLTRSQDGPRPSTATSAGCTTRSKCGHPTDPVSPALSAGTKTSEE